jgi:two-component system chemotaxis response regulator CheB
VIGGSAGSFHALLTLVRSLPNDFNVAVCVVMHLAPNSNVSFLIQHIQNTTSFTCKLAKDGEKVRPGFLYLAIPDVHLLLARQHLKFGDGPDENRFKPSIDVLFRSAAVDFRERTIGIIISGLLDDGVAGMAAINRCGGICLVQDPTDAEYPDLPLAVLEKVEADHIVPVREAAAVLLKAVQQKRPARKVPKALAQEVEIAERMLTEIDETRKLGTQSLFTCPSCGGTLFHVQDDALSRYRCFTGHAFSENGLLEKQNEGVLMTLWTSLRLLEERKKMLEKIPQTARTKKRQRDLNKHVSTLKALLADVERLAVPH